MQVPAAQFLRSAAVLRRLALASVVANVAIVVTGGAVRLTGSGLGCPTWPTCTNDSFVPTGELGIHSMIEFTNRSLTFVLTVIAISTLAVAILNRREVLLASLAFGGIPAQAVLGGVTVLTGLNPWTVACHFLLSMVIIAVTFTLWWRVTERWVVPAPRAVRAACWSTVGLTALVLAAGTVVTGSGPHAGDADTRRMGFSPEAVAQLHADLVMVLIGVTLALVLLARASGGAPAVARAARDLLAIELAQGLIGFVQYFTEVPALLVGLHMLGAALVWVAALRLLVEARGPALAFAR